MTMNNRSRYGSGRVEAGDLDFSGTNDRVMVVGNKSRAVIPYNKSKIEPCDVLTDWTPSAACTEAADTVNFMCMATNPQSIKYTPSAGTSKRFTLDYAGAPIDIANKFIHVRYYIHEGTGASSYTNLLGLRFACVKEDGWTNYRTTTLAGTANSIGTRFNADIEPGWHDAIWDAEFIAYSSTGGTYDSATTKLLAWDMFYTEGTTPSVTIDEVSFINKLTLPLIAFRFDDGADGLYEIAAYMARYGLRGTFYVVPTLVGTAGYLTLDQLQNMHQMGHVIANHTYEHLYPSTDGANKAACVDSICKAAEWLTRYGFGDGAKLFAVPGGMGEWPRSIIDLQREALGVYIDQLSVSGSMHVTYPLYPDRIPSTIWIEEGTSDESTLDAAYAAAKSGGGLCVPGFHHELSADHYTQAQLETFIDTIATDHYAGTSKCVTMAEILAGNIT